MFILMSLAVVLHEVVLSQFLLQCKCKVKLMGVKCGNLKLPHIQPLYKHGVWFMFQKQLLSQNTVILYFYHCYLLTICRYIYFIYPKCCIYHFKM